MRLSDSAHTSRGWHIHDLTPDFRLEDVWALPVDGARGDFLRLVNQFASGDPTRSFRGPAGALWWLRARLGHLLAWDRPENGVGGRVASLRGRLPEALRDVPPGPAFDSLPFTSVYLLDDEWAAESANRTMHGVLHLGWIPDPAGGYRGQMAVLVKPNGLRGELYMAAIRPVRHLIVYPALMRQIEHQWRRGTHAATPPGVAA